MTGDAATSPPLTLEWLPGRYAVCRLDSDAALPSWIQAGATPRVGRPQVPALPSLLTITRTERELAVVIDQSLIPPDAENDANFKAERDFIALRIVGMVDFSLVGILAKLTGALAAAKVPVFVISTFETDVLMVRSIYRAKATAALETTARIAADESSK